MTDLLARLRDADTTRRIGESYADTHERRQRDRDEAAARIEKLEAEAKARTLEHLGQVGQLSEELERVRAALREIADMIPYATPDYSHRVWTTARAALEERT